MQSLTSQAENQIYAAYETQRRMLLGAQIARIFLGLEGIAALSLMIALLARVPLPSSWPAPDRGVFFLVNLALILTMAAFLAIALLGEWLRRAEWTTGSVTAAFLAGTILFNLIWGSGALSPFTIIGLMGFITPIIIAGLLRSTRDVIVTMLVGNVFTLVWLNMALGQAPASASDLGFTLAALLLIMQWGVATLMLTVAHSIRQTMRDLGDVRVAFDRAQRLDELKDQFIASVNHELRNPIMTIQAYLQLLNERADDMAPERRHSLIARAYQVADTIGALLESILDARRTNLESKDFSLEAVIIRPLLDTAASLIDPREGALGDRELHIDIPEDLAVWAEPIRLQQIFVNLLSNAIKYSASGTPIEVTARQTVETITSGPRWHPSTTEHKQVEITIRDYGLGIPLAQQDLLFRKFARLPRDLGSNVVGNGLGLYLCRVLAEVMRGRIWVESSGIPGESATFHLRLLPPPSLPSTSATPSTEPALAPTTAEE